MRYNPGRERLGPRTSLGSGLHQFFFPDAPAAALEGYLFAVVCCAAAFALRFVIEPFLEEHSAFLLFALSIAVSAIRAGFGPGVFATILGAIGGLYFFPPVGEIFFIAPEFRLTFIVELSLFLVVGVILSWLGGELRRLRWKAAAIAEDRKQILESITDGFEALDRDCRFVYVNQAAAELAKGAQADLIGGNIWDLIPEWRGTVVEQKFHEVLENCIPARFEYQSKDLRWLEFHVHPAKDGGLTVYFSDITGRKVVEQRLRETLSERDDALRDVQLLSGLLPICASCKRIRDEQGWQPLESYISGHSQATFTHGLCPDCARTYFNELHRMSKPPR